MMFIRPKTCQFTGKNTRSRDSNLTCSYSDLNITSKFGGQQKLVKTQSEINLKNKDEKKSSNKKVSYFGLIRKSKTNTTA